jgi:hypothetical protein
MSKTSVLNCDLTFAVYSPVGKRYDSKYGYSDYVDCTVGPVSGPFNDPLKGGTYYTAEIVEKESAEELAPRTVRNHIEKLLKPYSGKR